jgi:hypothetical protein
MEIFSPCVLFTLCGKIKITEMILLNLENNAKSVIIANKKLVLDLRLRRRDRLINR